MTARRQLMVVDDFFAGAEQMRRVFNERLGAIRGAPKQRFVWDYWHVPGQYTYLRTFAADFFPPDLYARFSDRQKSSVS